MTSAGTVADDKAGTGQPQAAGQQAADPRLAETIERAHHLARSGLDEARRAIGMLRDEELPGPELLAALVEEFQADRGVVGLARRLRRVKEAADELARQVSLGAVALKIHPVHGGFEARDRMLYPAYAWAQERQLPVIVHCGTSTFPGSSNSFADPVLLDDVLRDFRRLDVVLAHGGRGWWYDAAAFMALSSDRVWIELSGLPPSRRACPQTSPRPLRPCISRSWCCPSKTYPAIRASSIWPTASQTI